MCQVRKFGGKEGFSLSLLLPEPAIENFAVPLLGEEGGERFPLLPPEAHSGKGKGGEFAATTSFKPLLATLPTKETSVGSPSLPSAKTSVNTRAKKGGKRLQKRILLVRKRPLFSPELPR